MVKTQVNWTQKPITTSRLSAVFLNSPTYTLKNPKQSANASALTDAPKLSV